jgi:CHAT domain-containing protein
MFKYLLLPIIHLAMHGLLNPQSELLSSLAFTETNNPKSDNFLHAYEISQMELNADLVVLSACETGYGKFQEGNGLTSLARSFMYAGVPALVVSLWQVNDAATANIMTTFYDELSKGKDKARALQIAKLDYLENAKGLGAHPAFWSPFVLLGNEDSIVLGSSFVYWPWLVGVGALLLSFALFLGRRKKK